MILKEIYPVFQCLICLLTSQPNFLLFPTLELPTAELRIYFRRALWHEHEFHATQIRINVAIETRSHEGARGICASEEVVRTAWAVEAGAGGNIVDCAVDCQVKGLSGIGAIVGAELGICEKDG